MSDKPTKKLRAFDPSKYKDKLEEFLSYKPSYNEELLDKILNKVNFIAQNNFEANSMFSTEFAKALESDLIPKEIVNIYLASYFDTEVSNGGFAQYIWNCRLLFLDLTKTALENINAKKQLEIYLEVLDYLLSVSQEELDQFFELGVFHTPENQNLFTVRDKINKIGQTNLDLEKIKLIEDLEKNNIPKKNWPKEARSFYDINPIITDLIFDYMEKNHSLCQKFLEI